MRTTRVQSAPKIASKPLKLAVSTPLSPSSIAYPPQQVARSSPPTRVQFLEHLSRILDNFWNGLYGWKKERWPTSRILVRSDRLTVELKFGRPPRHRNATPPINYRERKEGGRITAAFEFPRESPRDVLEPQSVAFAYNQRAWSSIMPPYPPPPRTERRYSQRLARRPVSRGVCVESSFIYLAGQEAVHSSGSPAVTN